MPVVNRVAEFMGDIVAWRHDFHRNPELLYDLPRTAGRVAELLETFGVDEVVTGIGRSGVVGLIRGRNGGAGPTIGLRADMDALPITERSGRPYASTTPGRMHACGHDGHTVMLLGAARYLAETRNFAGTAAVIFQPAEEGGGGGRTMVEDGLMERFDIEAVYGLHNLPGLPVGHFGIRPGGIMAATDEFAIEVTGRGTHAAFPHHGADAVLTAAHMAVALQSVVARNVDPLQQAVVSVTMLRAGEAFNVLPSSAELRGTVRSLDSNVRDLLENRLKEVATGIATAFGCTAEIGYRRGYPVTVNAPAQTEFAERVAIEIAGRDQVDGTAPPTMAGEDFAYMLEVRPGAYIFLGNGPTSMLHSDTYDFTDEAIPFGVSYWIRLVEMALPIA